MTVWIEGCPGVRHVLSVCFCTRYVCTHAFSLAVNIYSHVHCVSIIFPLVDVHV